MTAEIAILNKSAVALAADSAVTISRGTSHTKVFDSADKLFELSCTQPIGIMIYNGMHFSGIPLLDLIKDFRELASGKEFEHVDEAADALLDFLLQVGKDSPEDITARTALSVALPIVKLFDQKFEDAFRRRLESDEPMSDFDAFQKETTERLLKLFEALSKRKSDTKFVGGAAPAKLSDLENEMIDLAMKRVLPSADKETLERLGTAVKNYVITGELSNSRTGIVVAGFGRKERFPTLVSFEIEGMISGGLKYKYTDKCDIDRLGKRAFIKPFAQKDMVDRFLYGLDDGIQNDVARFCREMVSAIAEEILDAADINEPAKVAELRAKIHDAETSFVRNLKEQGFSTIERKSQKEIEDMIEFMPKPELAKMAEALVELTSMKRKVSAGLETVGGPVDVAVISKSEGFVWIKRKHYFPQEYNPRYLSRARNNT